MKILVESCQKSVHDLAQVLVRRSCEDPDEILSEVLAVIAQVLMRRSCEDPAGIVYGVLA